MTDLDSFVELYKSLGIELAPIQTEDGYDLIFGRDGIGAPSMTTHEKFKGYGGFYTVVSFDENKKFIEQSFWK